MKNCGESNINKIKTISLGGMTSKEFLRDYWQKQPLLVRNALPDFKGLLTRDKLMELACNEAICEAKREEIKFYKDFL